MLYLDSGNDVDPMDMTAYSEAVSNSNRGSSDTTGKKRIQVYVPKNFSHKSETDLGVYSIIINFRETVWHLKSDFLMSCLEGLRNSSLFSLKYSAADMTWFDNISDFSIRMVEHSLNRLK